MCVDWAKSFILFLAIFSHFRNAQLRMRKLNANFVLTVSQSVDSFCSSSVTLLLVGPLNWQLRKWFEVAHAATKIGLASIAITTGTGITGHSFW